MAEAKTNGEAPDKEELENIERALGKILWFMSETRAHRHMFLLDIHAFVLPALRLKQYKIIQDNAGRMIAYVSWAMASENLERRLLSGVVRLRPNDWKGGDKAIVVHCLCPNGAEKKVLTAVKTAVFSERSFYVVTPDFEGKPQLQEVMLPPKPN